MGTLPDTEKGFTELLASARGGSKQALGMLLESCRLSLGTVALRLKAHHLDRKEGEADLLQDTFLEGVRDFHKFHGSTKVELLVWVGRIARNNLRDLVRKWYGGEKRRVDHEISLDSGNAAAHFQKTLVDAGPSPAARSEEQEFRDLCYQASAGLPVTYKLVIRLSIFEGQPLMEVGRQLACSPEAARKLRFRALRNLVNAMDELQPGWSEPYRNEAQGGRHT
jgi:RNA polymerase sigma factor (sigma-70 family)